MKRKINMAKSFELLEYFINKPVKDWDDLKIIKTTMEVIIND